MTEDASGRPAVLISPGDQAHTPSEPPHAAPLQDALRDPLFVEAPHATALLDRQGRIQAVNTEGAALLNAPASALRGRLLGNLLGPGSHSTLNLLISLVFEGRGVQRTELQAAAPCGAPAHLLLAGRLYHHGAAPLCQLTFTDVTAYTAAHQSLLQTTQQLGEDVQRHARRFKQLGDEFRDVMFVAQRDLGTSLTRAHHLLQAYDEQQNAAEQASLAHVKDAVTDSQALLRALHTYMHARSMRVRLHPTDLNKVLRDVLHELTPLHEGRSLNLSILPLPALSGDQQALHFILREYFVNALKFTRTRPEVHLRLLVHETGQEYWIGVQDNGVGFNMRQKDKLFELFTKLHPTDPYEGPGAGLAVVRRLCTRFGGRAWGEGKVEQGATFWFAWPKTLQLE
ncbi:sensor histidine kinase [Deinococcus kurensis]|uniref:sensor histidine kinase n=1 Tax=Deinococcus kurensis TaxID=2662757 RepID=UPI0012D2EAE1|nr:ATP-binding protein [Deinococcus kurensis]